MKGVKRGEGEGEEKGGSIIFSLSSPLLLPHMCGDDSKISKKMIGRGGREKVVRGLSRCSLSLLPSCLWYLRIININLFHFNECHTTTPKFEDAIVILH